ncbi:MULTISPECIES: phosphoribosyl-AMP cyclohydrolase [Modicisalibacter]|uniref:phosphoribosyl-AMP cyclohydrolase n=1 Tax=Modicisalibacter TaxID=574347 RepID=UPI00100AD6B1|nr:MULTISPECIES: phosphoribosyl-AMP cyclohydrolase [Halomonadaceae]MBZ9556660.1 phosphoribosyl-AMP cyclohydrolase [Modicisalibacter sp. R2A 31.J]MBZ9574871.1 phosphoribosyl-AMP cyclohydrolase [Modicisalibacter sp. MOD 31.J]
MTTLFKTLESAERGTTRSTNALLDAVRWNDDGLVPVIAQQHDSGEVLMMAWMNRLALEETLTTGWVCYWSRSRSKLWRKGETSGQLQRLESAHFDCDGDTLLVKVDQQGPACHTGRRSCFYIALGAERGEVDADALVDPGELYGQSR